MVGKFKVLQHEGLSDRLWMKEEENPYSIAQIEIQLTFIHNNVKNRGYGRKNSKWLFS
jgi:hypothetical protein